MAKRLTPNTVAQAFLPALTVTRMTSLTGG
jgi:hypothetical protein